MVVHCYFVGRNAIFVNMINLSLMCSRCLEWIDILCLPLEERAVFTFMYIFNFEYIKYIANSRKTTEVPKVSLFTHIFKTLITLMIDLVLYWVCVCGGGGGGLTWNKKLSNISVGLN